MDLYVLIFYFFVALTLGSASIVVFSRNIVHAAFALLFSFIGVVGIYVFLFADFLAITQLLIYVGGITVLVLFGVMLTSRQIDVDAKTGIVQTIPGILLAACIGGGLVWIFWRTDWKAIPQPPAVESTASTIGELLLTTYLVPFEIASVVLLVALVGAAMIARREKKAS
jgi:NADH-quinone oxidoreductase subunit J